MKRNGLLQVAFMTVVLICTLLPISNTLASHAKTTYKVPILTYHAIGNYEGRGTPALYVSEKNFEKQMNYLKSAGYTPITFLDLDDLKIFSKPVLITFIGGDQTVWKAYQILKRINGADFASKANLFMVMNKIDKATGLTSAQLQEMSASGIFSIQSHTITNTDLTVTNNMQHELKDSQKLLEKITGQKAVALAYPHGKYDEHVINATKEFYKYALTDEPGFITEQTNPYKLRRIPIDFTTTMAMFKEFVQPRQD
ncbi:polysaccharide deacetylase family protein [Virgibacillus sp. 179-BFC.A HS]|uniref:Polysaccharide deacetylase family protein n=1 Tax=Tigheibacillus jepli TaxID=3035914 RepID=A0ABU5CE61_9BACI|nr:polysaccharide deacetylase family protein [Virgibacillus sp. 179-BFC.A HS]MDY0404608.1 polysaccharide deacetylase family protein [Virgibacillus sp. 179-BFC.A HS]